MMFIEFDILSFFIGLCFAPLIAATSAYLFCARTKPKKNAASIDSLIQQEATKISASAKPVDRFEVTNLSELIGPINNIALRLSEIDVSAIATSVSSIGDSINDIDVNVSLDITPLMAQLKNIAESCDAQYQELSEIKKTTDAWRASALYLNAKRGRR